MPLLSIIVPVYNRVAEVEELLSSLAKQTDKNFETIIVEDGSTESSQQVAERYQQEANVKYYYKPNGGRSQARNHGMERANGSWLLFFDSDCVIPPNYIEQVQGRIASSEFDCYGGPDAADSSFTTLQKSINYSMTSLFTTGGIRGNKRSMEKFLPRTFNMGFTVEVYKKVGDYRDVFGEDIDMSLRIKEAGYKTILIPEAFVYHKRRNTVRSFARQMVIFGRSRVELHQLHPGSMQLVHLLPTLFMLGSIALIVASIFIPVVIVPLIVYYVAIVVESLLKTGSIKVALLSPVTSTIQLWGYAIGFLRTYIKEIIFKRGVDRNSEMRKLKYK